MSQEESKPSPDETGADDLAECVDSALGDEQENWSDADARESGITRLEAELREAQKTALRHQAELENFRKRMRREMEQDRQYAALPIIQDLLAVVDHLDLAIQASEQNENSSGLLEGVKMVATQLQAVLEKHGCQVIEPIGQPFDPHYHEALAPEPSHEYPPGTVTRVTKTGYRLHDRVIRPAQVFVSAEMAPAATDDDATTNSAQDTSPDA
jgi:molecular chaperone GrpE